MMTTVRNERLASAVCDLVVAARPIVDDIVRENDMVAPQHVRWVAEDDAFIRKAVPSTSMDWGGALAPGRMLQLLSSLPQYHDAMKQLLSDPAVAALLGKYVGSHFGLSIFRPEEVLRDAVILAVTGHGQADDNEVTVRAAWESIEASLYSDEVRYVIVAPLIGVKLGEDAMTLAPGITIDRLVDSELLRCFDAELFRDVGMDAPSGYRAVGRHEVPEYGLRIVTSYPRPVHERRTVEPGIDMPIGYPAIGAEAAAPWDLLGPVERALTTLRLHQPGFVSAPGAVLWSNEYFGRAARSWATRDHLHPRYRPPGYILSPGEQPQLKTLWRALDSEGVRQRGTLQLALRRLNFGIDRWRVDDSIVDLLICAEALLLQDQGTRTELRFRVALRAGRTFECQAYGPRDVFRIVKAAYDARSAIVHGSEAKRVRLPGRGNLDIDEFVPILEGIMRDGAKTIVLRASGTSSQEPIVEPDESLLPVSKAVSD